MDGFAQQNFKDGIKNRSLSKADMDSERGDLATLVSDCNRVKA